MHFKHYQRTLRAIQPDNYHKIHHIFIFEFTCQIIWFRSSAKMERKVTGRPLSVVNLSRLSRENLGLPCACVWIFVLLLGQWYQMVHWLCPGWVGALEFAMFTHEATTKKKRKKGCFLRMNGNALHVGLKSYCSDEEQVIFHFFFQIQFSEMWTNESLINQ